MSFDLPTSVESELRRYALAENLSPSEAAVKLIRDALKTKKPKVAKENLVTDEQIRELKALDGSFGILEDVSEEQIDRIAASIRRSKREGFAKRA